MVYFLKDMRCREVEHKQGRVRAQTEAMETERQQLVRDRGLWAEQRGAALAASEKAATLQAALASHMKGTPNFQVSIRTRLIQLNAMFCRGLKPSHETSLST